MAARKTVTALLLALVLVFGSLTGLQAATSIEIYVDGSKVVSDVAPVIENGTTLVPLRIISENFGARVNWNDATSAVTVNSAANDVKLVVGSKSATVNGANQTLSIAAKLINGRTFVPLRFVGESLGANVDYDAKTNRVNIKYFSDMAGTITIGGSTTIQPVAEAVAGILKGMNSGLSVTVVGGGSGNGVKGAASGEFNIGNASRDVKDSEMATYPDLISHKIGSDAIAVVVNPANPVKALTRQQVFDIFTGKIVNWNEVGGNNAPIFVQTREAGSGTLDGFNEKAIHAIDANGAIVASAIAHTSNGLVKEAVANGANTIGFISLAYVDSSVKAVSIDSIPATVEKAQSGEYAYVRPLNVLTKGRPNLLAAKFIDFYTTPKGIEAMEEEGYLPLQ